MSQSVLKRVGKRLLVWIRNLFLILFTSSLLVVVLYKYIPVYQPLNVVARRVVQLFSQEELAIKHQWVPLKNISPEVVQAVLASEDQLFLIHNGFDFGGQEINPNLPIRNRYDSNAGTISVQTAQLVFLLPADNYVHKTLQTYFTLLIEFVWGKERILEVYLNSVEMANGIYGVESMAETFFQKEEEGPSQAARLTEDEAAMIAVMLTNPREQDPLQPSGYMLRHQAKILSLMEKMIPIEF